LRGPLVSLLIAVAIVVVAYPEVVFLGGSLSPVGLNGVVDRHRVVSTVQIYPNVPSRGVSATSALARAPRPFIVVFHYDSKARRAGAVISLATLFGLAAGAIVRGQAGEASTRNCFPCTRHSAGARRYRRVRAGEAGSRLRNENGKNRGITSVTR
jgi:hypothetical protein